MNATDALGRLSDDESPGETGSITGTVTDTYGDVVPGALVAVDPINGGARKTRAADDSGHFAVADLSPNVAYRVTITAPGFDPWVAPSVTVRPGEYIEVTGIKLRLNVGVTSVTVRSDPIEIATEQVQVEEKQRILGLPNFYVVYDSRNAVPLTTRLKFQMIRRRNGFARSEQRVAGVSPPSSDSQRQAPAVGVATTFVVFPGFEWRWSY